MNQKRKGTTEQTDKIYEALEVILKSNKEIQFVLSKNKLDSILPKSMSEKFDYQVNITEQALKQYDEFMFWVKNFWYFFQYEASEHHKKEASFLLEKFPKWLYSSMLFR